MSAAPLPQFGDAVLVLLRTAVLDVVAQGPVTGVAVAPRQVQTKTVRLALMGREDRQALINLPKPL